MLRCSGRSKYKASKALCVLTQGDSPLAKQVHWLCYANYPAPTPFPELHSSLEWKWEALLQAFLNFPNRLSEPRATISLSCELILLPVHTIGKPHTFTSFALGFALGVISCISLTCSSSIVGLHSIYFLWWPLCLMWPGYTVQSVWGCDLAPCLGSGSAAGHTLHLSIWIGEICTL